MVLAYRLARIFKRSLLPLIALLYACYTLFNLHTRNIYHNNFNQVEPYTGGPIDDIKIIKCYAWNGVCNQIIEKSQVASDDGAESHSEEVTWLRVPRNVDINGKSSRDWSLYHEYLYVHLSKHKRFNSPSRAIVNVALAKAGATEPPAFVVKDSQTSTGRPRSRVDVTNNYHNWDLRDNGIWVKYDKTNAEDAVIGMTYLFGENVIEPRFDWTLTDGELVSNAPTPLKLSIKRKGEEKKPLKPLRYSNSEFKVLQLSDLHFSSNFGHCKDQFQPASDCKADPKSLLFIHQVLDAESPDLVVITGDLIDGFNAFDYQTAILKALSPMITRSIPYAVALGDHDKSQFVDQYEIIDFIASLPFATMSTKDKENYGEVSNYAIKVFDETNESEIQSMIYILGTYTESVEDQAARFIKNTFDRLDNTPKLSLEFQHYPIKEYRPKGSFAIVGQYHEKHRLNAKTDPETRKILSEAKVQAMSVGFEHTNECCIESDGKDGGLTPLWMCYGGSVGEGAYGNPKQDRRVRLFRLDTKKMEITSWKRSQSQPAIVFDYQYIYRAN